MSFLKKNYMKLTIWTQSEDIPFKIVQDKDKANIFADVILQNLKHCIMSGKFPDQLIKADVSPVFKKGNYNNKT